MEYDPTLTVNSASSHIDKEDLEWMLREQIHAQQCEINALRKALMYVHPKTLTTEEICEIYREIFGFRPLDKYSHIFANAIIRKAQEK
jgi:hypothetical protein